MMLRRIIDLSLLTPPHAVPHTLRDASLPPHLESTGPERSGKLVQKVFRFTPYAYENNAIGADFYLGDSLPHTHAEVLLQNEVTVLGQVPAHNRWAIRDIASVPAPEWTCEAAVLDLSDLDPGVPYPLTAIQERTTHLQWGDFLILRTGYRSQRWGSQVKAPGLTMEVARWLVERRGIVGIMADTTVDNPTRPEGVHTYFYLNGVLMIDNAAGFAALPAERVYLAGGLTLKTSGIGSCPARPVVFPRPEKPLERSEPIDLFHGISIAPDQNVPLRFRRLEPYELQSDAFKRYQIVPVQIAGDRAAEERQHTDVSVRAQRDFGSPIRLFNSRLGTHIIQPYQATGSATDGTMELIATQTASTSSLVGRGLRIDLQEEAGPRQVVSRQLVQRQAARLQAGDIAVLWTGFTDRSYHRPDYLKWSPRFSPEAIAWLLEQGVKLIITDATTIEAWPWESPEAHTAEEQCRLQGVPVVLAATNLWLMEQDEAYFICSPVPITGFPIVPARVVAVEEYR